MVNSTNQHTGEPPANQGPHMTAYGGWLPVATMLEKMRFQEWIAQHVTIQRLTTSMPGFRFVLGMILALYVGFSRWHHLQSLQRGPMLTGILEVGELPAPSTFWRFLATLHLVVAKPLRGGGPADAAARLGSRPRGMKRSPVGYGHHGVRPADGSPPRLSPQTSGEEEL
jgi:hypothetical protein